MKIIFMRCLVGRPWTARKNKALDEDDPKS